MMTELTARMAKYGCYWKDASLHYLCSPLAPGAELGIPDGLGKMYTVPRVKMFEPLGSITDKTGSTSAAVDYRLGKAYFRWWLYRPVLIGRAISRHGHHQYGNVDILEGAP